MTEARTNLRAFAIIGIAEERSGAPDTWVVVKKVVYTKEAADASVEKSNAKADGRTYFWQSTSIEPLLG
jgi:hypothetical protein